MGWTYTHKDSDQSVKDFMAKQFNYEKDGRSGKILDCAIVKFRTYYAAYEVKAADKPTEVIGLVCLLGYAKDYYNFGYKDMTEDMGPCESECPDRILNLLTPTTSEYATEWRKRCREAIAKRAVAKRVTPGTLVRFADPLKFTSGATLQTLRFVKGNIFAAPSGEWGRFRISRWTQRPYEVVPG